MMRNPFRVGNPFYLCIAPVVWSIHFLCCYLLASLACGLISAETAVRGIAVVTAIALGLLGYVAWTCNRHRTQRRQVALPSKTDPASADLTTRVTIGLCALSALTLLWVAYPSLVLPACVA